MTDGFDADQLQQHLGRRLTDDDVATVAPANLLRRTLDLDGADLTLGDELPDGWHGLYFLPLLAPGELRDDGLPAGVDVIPPLPLPRRMYAGETLRFHQPIRLGQALRRSSELIDLVPKTGGKGRMVFATVLNKIMADGELALEEERRIVYLEAVPPGQANQPTRREAAPGDAAWQQIVQPDPVLLFRYSALTFNSHRIHYDSVYATRTEGYPGLVVHGPLTSTLLMELARRHNPGRRFATYQMQARAPLFDTAPFTVAGKRTGGGCSLWAATPDGTVAMTAELSFA